MDVWQLRVGVRDGRLSVDRLLDTIDKLDQTVKRLQAQLDRPAQYEPEVARETRSSASQTPPPSSNVGFPPEKIGRTCRSGFRVARNSGPGGASSACANPFGILIWDAESCDFGVFQSDWHGIR
jgi:hypothetical protein